MADADPKFDIQAIEGLAIEAQPTRKAWLRPVLMFSVPAVIVTFALVAWLMSGRFASTDNAYVQQDKVSVSADVAGRIVSLPVAAG